MAELGAFFGNPNIQRQGARARALAAQRDVNTLADPRTYAVVQGLLGTAPDEMGFSVLNPDYEKIRKVAEPAFALGLLGQASPLLAPMTKGLPVGASIKNVGKDLSAIQIGDRTIPVTINRIDKKSGGELVNVNPSAFDEAFSKTSWQYVGEKGKDGISGRYEKFQNFLKDAKSIEASNVSVNKDGGVVFGDGRHRYAVLRDMGLDELPIVMDKESIKNAKKFGYLADTKAAPRQEALDTAQRNAALPIEEGGLGLPKDNTPEMRAAAMGFDTPVYHGTNEDINIFNVEGKGKTSGAGAFFTTNPTAAETYVSSSGGGNILPLLLRKDDFLTANARGRNWADIYTNELGAKAGKKRYSLEDLELDRDSATTTDELGIIASNLGLKGAEIRNVKDLGPNSHVMRAKEYLADKYGITPDETWSNVSGKQFDEAQKYKNKFYESQKGDIYAIQDPSLLRSRNAAFDPMRRNEADILAGVLPLGLLADEDQRKKLYELMPSLLGE